MASFVYSTYKSDVQKKVHDLLNDTLKMMLITSAVAPVHSDSAVSGYTEVTSTGYTAGGATLASKTLSAGPVAGTIKFDAADVAWSGVTFTARYGIIYNTSASNKPIACIDFGSDKSPSASDFTVQVNADGFFYW